MFTTQQGQYILNCLDQETKRTGLQNAAFALGIAAELQTMIIPEEPAPAEEAPDKKTK